MRARPTGLALALATVLLVSACSDGADPADGSDGAAPADGFDGDALVIYSGRNENLVGPLLDRLEEAVGVPVEVRYASSSELAAQLLEEGDATAADLFLSQDAGALGALAKADMLEALPEDVLSAVSEDYRDDEGRWVATSGRARVLAYHPEEAPDVPSITSIDELLEPRYEGIVGYAPSNASFHTFVTALRVDRGDDEAREWLEAFAAQRPQAYENNIAVLDAVDRGEVGVGLINHYYWFRKSAEEGELDARLHFLGSDDPGALVNVAGAGVLTGSDQRDAAVRAVEFFLSEEAQRYFAEETAEYPVIEDVESPYDLQPLEDRHRIDLNDLDSLEETLAMLDEVGLT